MVQAAAPKAKVVYHDTNLSALAIANLATSIHSEIQVVKAPKPNVNRPEFYHVELKIGTDIINGELSIMDYIVAEKNRDNSAKGGVSNNAFFLQGHASQLSFDDWISVLNKRLRPATNSFAVTKDGAVVKEVIKAIAKALEDQNIFDMLTGETDATNRYAYLASLVFAYLEPAQELLS